MNRFTLEIDIPEPGDPSGLLIEALGNAIGWLCRNQPTPEVEFDAFDRAGVKVGRAKMEETPMLDDPHPDPLELAQSRHPLAYDLGRLLHRLGCRCPRPLHGDEPREALIAGWWAAERARRWALTAEQRVAEALGCVG